MSKLITCNNLYNKGESVFYRAYLAKTVLHILQQKNFRVFPLFFRSHWIGKLFFSFQPFIVVKSYPTFCTHIEKSQGGTLKC